MKIIIWVHKNDIISGNITKYYNTIPHLGQNEYENYFQVEITHELFCQLDDELVITPEVEERIRLENDLDEEGENLFKDEEAMIHERNPDTGEIRSRKVCNHNPLYFDFTRNMDAEQTKAYHKKTGLTPDQPFAQWYEGLSPIEKNRWNNGYNLDN